MNNQKKESFASKFGLTLITALLTFVAGYLVQRLTTKEAEIVVTLSEPKVAIDENRVEQVVSVRNNGKDLAKHVRIVIRGLDQGRLFAEKFRVLQDPPAIDSEPQPKPSYSSTGDLALAVADLQPSATDTIFLVFKKPKLSTGDIDCFSDNATARKLFVPIFSETTTPY